MEEIKINQKRELFTPDTMCVREAEAGKPMVIEGCAIVFNKQTTLYEDDYYRMREVILPSCISEEFLASQDVKLNLLHKRSKSLARNNKGKGTLHMEIREDGLWFSVELPDCDLGRQAYELVKNGTYTGCSFEFYPGDYTRDVTRLSNGGEDVLISHQSFKELSALTIALDPAYDQTEVAAREAYSAELREQAECKKHEEDENKPADEPEAPQADNEPSEEQKAAEEAEKECKQREYAKTRLQANLILCDEDYQ